MHWGFANEMSSTQSSSAPFLSNFCPNQAVRPGSFSLSLPWIFLLIGKTGQTPARNETPIRLHSYSIKNLSGTPKLLSFCYVCTSKFILET